jgi:hypothetical protein
MKMPPTTNHVIQANEYTGRKMEVEQQCPLAQNPKPTQRVAKILVDVSHNITRRQ